MSKEKTTVHADLKDKKAINKVNNVPNRTKYIEESILNNMIIEELGGIENVKRLIEEGKDFKEKFFELVFNYSRQNSPAVAYTQPTEPKKPITNQEEVVETQIVETKEEPQEEKTESEKLKEEFTSDPDLMNALSGVSG